MRKKPIMETQNTPQALTAPLTRVLMIDDDIELTDLVAEYLRREGMHIDAVHDGESGVARAQNDEYSAVILDVMLPGIGGFEVLRRLRAPDSVTAKLPVVMLTARGDEVDRVLGLETGADDYLAKPFSSRELVARLRAILRRAGAGSSEENQGRAPLCVGDLELDAATRTLKRGGEIIEITSAEFELMNILLRSSGEIVTRERIAKDALGRALMPYDRSIDVHISNLRRKLSTHGDGSERIKSVRGIGYIYTRPAGE